MLDGSASFDPENDLNPDNPYLWKQTAGTVVTLSAPGAINPTFTAPPVPDNSSETLVFELTVTDSGQLQATDTVEILVEGAVIEPEPDPEPQPQPEPDEDDCHKHRHRDRCQDRDDDDGRDCDEDRDRDRDDDDDRD